MMLYQASGMSSGDSRNWLRSVIVSLLRSNPLPDRSAAHTHGLVPSPWGATSYPGQVVTREGTAPTYGQFTMNQPTTVGCADDFFRRTTKELWAGFGTQRTTSPPVALWVTASTMLAADSATLPTVPAPLFAPIVSSPLRANTAVPSTCRAGPVASRPKPLSACTPAPAPELWPTTPSPVALEPRTPKPLPRFS